LAPSGASRADCLNDKGQVVGSASAGRNRHAFIWDAVRNAGSGTRDPIAMRQASITPADRWFCRGFQSPPYGGMGAGPEAMGTTPADAGSNPPSRLPSLRRCLHGLSSGYRMIDSATQPAGDRIAAVAWLSDGSA
jgi:hypothetical protein